MKSEQPLMFPEVPMHTKIHSPKFVAGLVGDFFELMTLSVLGGQRFHTEGCDGIYKDEERYWESKAAMLGNKGRGFKLIAQQTEFNLVDATMPTDYALWSYKSPDTGISLTKSSETVGDLIRYLNQSIVKVHIIPHENLNDLLTFDGVRYSTYQGWKGFSCWRIPHWSLNKMQWNGHAGFVYPKKNRFEYYGQKMETNLFTVIRHKKIEPKPCENENIPF